MTETPLGSYEEKLNRVPPERKSFWTEWSKGRTDEERGEMLAQKEREAEHDTLTGAKNRRGMEIVLENEAARMKRDPEKRPVGILYIDMDGLKVVNDVFGHKDGDIYIKNVAMTIKDSIRAIDEFGRWGGDEFLVVLPQASEQITEQVAMRIFGNLNGQLISIGLTLLLGDEDPLEKVNRADDAMREAKKLGKQPGERSRGVGLMKLM